MILTWNSKKPIYLVLAPYLAAAATLATLVGVVDVVAAERVAAAATLATI